MELQTKNHFAVDALPVDVRHREDWRAKKPAA
jgi:hypothetical protein